jgi:hypothetical protein
VVRRFSVAFQMEGQHPFMQVDELPLEGLHNGRVYQVGHCFNGDFPAWSAHRAHRCYPGKEVWALGNGLEAHVYSAPHASVGSLSCTAFTRRHSNLSRAQLQLGCAECCTDCSVQGPSPLDMCREPPVALDYIWAADMVWHTHQIRRCAALLFEPDEMSLALRFTHQIPSAPSVCKP